MLALLAGCAGTPRPADTGVSRDGPPANPPPGLLETPDAEPRVEPIRSGGPNKPYQVLGQAYTPLNSDAPLAETGLASWYGRKFHGSPTASGETYDMYAMSAAHRTMPLPSYARVRNPGNGREVVVRINDRGPFHADRVIDLSYAAAARLGVLGGVAPVQVQRLTHEDIRSGRWRGDAGPMLAATPVPVAIAAAAAPAATGVPATPAAPAAPAAPATASIGPGAQTIEASTPEPVPPLAVAARDAQPGAAPPQASAPQASEAGFWVQLGAFRQRQGAIDLQLQLMRELAWLEPWLAIFDDRSVYRVQAGPYPTRGAAQNAAVRLRAAGTWQPMIVQRR